MSSAEAQAVEMLREVVAELRRLDVDETKVLAAIGLLERQEVTAAVRELVESQRDYEWQKALGDLHQGFDGDGSDGDAIGWSVAALQRRLDRDADWYEERNAEWQAATGLTCGGDPGGVTPAMLAEYVGESDAILRSLVTFAEHQRGCVFLDVQGNECTCGLWAVLDRVKALPPEDGARNAVRVEGDLVRAARAFSIAAAQLVGCNGTEQDIALHDEYDKKKRTLRKAMLDAFTAAEERGMRP